MKNLVLYGDSLLAQTDKSRTVRLEKVLSNEFIVSNAATSGFNTDDSLKRAEFINNLPSDNIVISLGTNDAKPWAQVSVNAYTKNIKALLSVFGKNKVIWFLPPILNEKRLTPKHAELTNEVITKYRNAAKQVLVDNQVRFIDSEVVFQKLIDQNKDYHVDDGVHLNELGYDTVFNELVRLLNS